MVYKKGVALQAQIQRNILSFCLNVKTNTKSINPKVSKISNRKIMLLSKCAVYDSKKIRFIKEQEASGLLIKLGIKNP